MNRFKDPDSFAIPEPRIRYIAHELARLLDFVELEQDGRPIKVDGFRLQIFRNGWITVPIPQ